MSLGKKVSIVAILLGVVFSVGTFAALRAIVLPAFGDLEVEAVEKDRARIRASFAAELGMLETVNREYSTWTQAYEFARGENPEFSERELTPENWVSSGADLILVFNREDELIYSWYGDPSTGLQRDILKELPAGLLDPRNPGFDRLRRARGLLKIPSGLIQIVSLPILDSEGRGPPQGFFTTGRFYTDARMMSMAQQANGDLSIHYDISDTAAPEVRAAIASASDEDQPFALFLDDGSVHLYEVITDIRDEIIGVLQMSVARKVSKIGEVTIRYAAMVIAFASAVFLLAALAFMHFRIVSPIKQLIALMQTMRRTGRLDAVASTDRDDEIGMLGREFNELTRKLDEARSELEEARDEAIEMSRAKSEFLARMSHEIRTPMNGVLGMAELLRGTQVTDRQRRFVNTIYDSGNTLLALINDILDFSKIEAGKLRMESLAVDLRRLVEEAVDGFVEAAGSKDIELIVMVAAEAETHVFTDPIRLRQVMVNLIGNALKFTKSGEVVVRLDTEEVGGKIMAHFEVRDTGIGIREENQAAIFESFTQEDGTTTRTYGGTGLGLTISRQIVDLLGGELGLRSTPGVGSTFFFTLPLEKDTEFRHARRGSTTVAGKRILVVDDNPTNLEILENHLSSWRAEVTCADSAARAIEILESDDESFDLAILDWHMPDTDGLELAAAIRRDLGRHELRLMMLSSLANSIDQDQCDDLCISRQITKPIRQDDLFDALLAVLGEAPGQRVRHHQLPQAERRLSGKVLLAEDNLVNQAVAVGMLGQIGLQVDLALNGEEAAERAATVAYDAILMDCQMPVLDGFDATRRIRHHEQDTDRPATPIIALTANALSGDRERCLEAGMSDYLSKPFTAEELYSVLTLWLKREPGPAGAANEDDAGEVSGRLAGA